MVFVFDQGDINVKNLDEPLVQHCIQYNKTN